MNTPIYQQWDIKYAELKAKFNDGSIVQHKRKELEQDLIILAMSNITKTEPQDIRANEAFKDVVVNLLQVRIGEELHESSRKISILALVVSVLALIATVCIGIKDEKVSKESSIQPIQTVEKTQATPP
jgi:hypothetical protein